MQESGYITPSPDLEPERQRRAQGGGAGEDDREQVKFEVTDKALDFLGYRALRDLLGSLGHSSAGRHDTRDLSTGIEASGAPKPYEFGDTHEPRRRPRRSSMRCNARSRTRTAMAGLSPTGRPGVTASTSTTRT